MGEGEGSMSKRTAGDMADGNQGMIVVCRTKRIWREMCFGKNEIDDRLAEDLVRTETILEDCCAQLMYHIVSAIGLR